MYDAFLEVHRRHGNATHFRMTKRFHFDVVGGVRHSVTNVVTFKSLDEFSYDYATILSIA